jgi:hypothetical protein
MRLSLALAGVVERSGEPHNCASVMQCAKQGAHNFVCITSVKGIYDWDKNNAPPLSAL